MARRLSQRRIDTRFTSGIEMHPTVAELLLTCRKKALPAAGVTGKRL
jgi:hypothetical protein